MLLSDWCVVVPDPSGHGATAISPPVIKSATLDDAVQVPTGLADRETIRELQKQSRYRILRDFLGILWTGVPAGNLLRESRPRFPDLVGRV